MIPPFGLLSSLSGITVWQTANIIRNCRTIADPGPPVSTNEIKSWALSRNIKGHYHFVTFSQLLTGVSVLVGTY